MRVPARSIVLETDLGLCIAVLWNIRIVILVGARYSRRNAGINKLNFQYLKPGSNVATLQLALPVLVFSSKPEHGYLNVSSHRLLNDVLPSVQSLSRQLAERAPVSVD